MNKEELQKILDSHQYWLNNITGGASAKLSGASLISASLISAKLSGAKLSGASLISAKLSGAELGVDDKRSWRG